MAYGTPPYTVRKNRNFLRSLLAGVAAPRQSDDPFSAFQSGLSGAMAYNQSEQDREQKEVEAELRRALQEREFGLDERRYYLDVKELIERERHNKEIEKGGGSTSKAVGFDDWLKMSPEQRAKYLEFKNLADNPERDPVATAKALAEMKKANPELFPEADPLAETETIVLERDPLGYPIRSITRRRRKSDTEVPSGFKRRPAKAYDLMTGKPVPEDSTPKVKPRASDFDR